MSAEIIDIDSFRTLGHTEAAEAYPLVRDVTLSIEVGGRAMSALIEEAIIPESVIADRLHSATTVEIKGRHGWEPRIVK